MRKYLQNRRILAAAAVIICAITSFSSLNAQPNAGKNKENTYSKDDSKGMPVYGHWKNFTTKDGLPNDHA